MKIHGQSTQFDSTRILEINTHHPVIAKLAELLNQAGSEQIVSDSIIVLFNQTLMAEGEPVRNPADFTKRLTRLVMKGVNTPTT